MLKTIIQLCEQIFPERGDHKIVRETKLSSFLRLLQPENNGDFISLMPFKNQVVRAFIHETKFHNNKRAQRFLAEALNLYLKHYNGEYILIPIPLSKNRIKERGYNQVLEVAKLTLDKIENKNIKINSNILYKIKNTKPQTSLPKKERLKNLKNAFEVAYPELINGKKIIIIDDVVTTGATIKEARAKLASQNPSEIISISLSH